jgi:sulfopyruvate decarboxylase subunit alpha
LNARSDVAKAVVEQAAECEVELVASLPDNWVAEVIREFDRDERFRHVPVNREESAVGLCSGAFLSGAGSLAVMGASGLMTLIYAITKINYTYEIPMTILATLRGAPGDRAKFHVSNGLYFLPSLDAISLTYTVIDSADKIPEIKRIYDHARTVSRPTVAILTRDVLRGEA